jgi:hypothetical protein
MTVRRLTALVMLIGGLGLVTAGDSYAGGTTLFRIPILGLRGSADSGSSGSGSSGSGGAPGDACAGATGTAGPFVFNSCGQTQNWAGPLSCSYTGKLANKVTVAGGIQSWTVPVTGNYSVTVMGASGRAAFSGQPSGRGISITTKLCLTQGTVLNILVGQVGSANSNDGGGGGGTFVVSNGSPLVVAGGGGGSGGFGPGYDASPSTTVTANGGSGAQHGGGGAGFADNGVNDASYGGQSFSYLNGGTGGGTTTNTCGSLEQAYGGWGGGGGGGCWWGGGGGGYSPSGQAGAGGNSFSINPITQWTWNLPTGNGSVTLTLP